MSGSVAGHRQALKGKNEYKVKETKKDGVRFSTTELDDLSRRHRAVTQQYAPAALSSAGPSSAGQSSVGQSSVGPSSAGLISADLSSVGLSSVG